LQNCRLEMERVVKNTIREAKKGTVSNKISRKLINRNPMKKSPQPPRIQETFMAAIGKGIRVVKSPAALALTALFALTRLAGAQPTVSAINVDGIILCTNTALTCTAASTGGTITNAVISGTTAVLGGTGTTEVSANLNSSSTGIGTATANISYALTTNLIYSLTVTVTDNTGATASTTATFDTLYPTLVIEAEDFNFSGGDYTNTPEDGGFCLYLNDVGKEGIDEHKGDPTNGTQGYYRPNDAVILQGAAPNNGTEQKYVTALANGDTTDVPMELGYNSTADWVDYTRDFGSASSNSAPAGTYSIWARMATDGGGQMSDFYEITSNPASSNQTENLLGSFNFTDANWNTFDYVPMVDAFGTLVSVTLTGHETLRDTIVGNPNIDFYMLVPAVPIVTPVLQYIYPDGAHIMEFTNSMSFTIGAANGAGIPSDAITLILNGENVTSGLKLTGSTNSWTGTFALQTNAVYSGQLTVSNLAGSNLVHSLSFDTFNPYNFQWESVDYDFSTNNGSVWISGLFIDNPVPTGDITAPATGHEATNSYFGYPAGITTNATSRGALAQQGIDIYFPDNQPLANDYYRPDGVGTSPSGDYARPQFVAAQKEYSDDNIGPMQIGYYDQYNWLNFTRTYPTGKFNVWGRLAGGAGPFSGTALSIVTSGVGTANQTSNVLGTFSDPNAAGWEAYHWVPMLDTGGNTAVVDLGGKATLKLTSGNNLNVGFFMLVPAVPSVVPILISSYPDGVQPFEITNTYTFTVSSASGPDIDSSAIGLVLNGVSVNSELTLTSSSTNWTASAPLVPNTVYNAVITVTNTGGEYSTFYKSFDTFDVNNYQWEANDYDYTITNGAVVTSALFIDNPVPTCDVNATGQGELVTNSYFGYPGGVTGAVAKSGVDFRDQATQTNLANDYYRADGQGSQPSGDYVRPKFVAAQTEFGDPNIGPFNMGYTTGGDWDNYTRHYPAGSFYVYGRLAGGGGAYGTAQHDPTLLAMVTSGVGTATQTYNVLGGFSDPNADGWNAWHWIPLLNTNTGNMAVVSLGGQATLKILCGGNLNEAYYMLVPAPTQLSPSLGASIVNGLLNISIPTLTGHNYQVVYSSVLSTNQSSWSAAGGVIVGTGSVTNVTEPLTGTQGYYEIKVQ
jgi:hypothetical protein